MQPQELSEGELVDIIEESDKKDDCVPEVMLTKSSTLKELSEIVCHNESTKDKMLLADPNLEGSSARYSRDTHSIS